MKTKSSFILLLFTSLMVMSLAFYSGFPLVESDTGAYIETGIRDIIPKDRSPFYGWFICYTSFTASLWYALLAQSLLLAFLLLRYMTHLNNKQQDVRLSVISVVVIVSFTCVTWVAAYLMPDIFAGILLLSILLYLSDTKGVKAIHILYCIIVFGAIIIHNSHFAIVLAFSVALLAWALVKKVYHVAKRSVVLLCSSISGWLLIATVNAVNGNGFVFSRGSHVFMVTKFAETGILNKYLTENCDSKHLKLCAYQNDIPDFSWDFLWGENSPLYKTGGWDSNKVEYEMITNDILTTPRYLIMYVQKAAIGTVRELTQVQAPNRTSYQGVWSSPWQRVKTFFPDELNEYCLSKQFSNELSGTASNYLYFTFFLLTSVWVLFYRKLLDENTLFLYGCMFLFFVVNAFVTSLGSTVIYRFQYRIFWILPATNAILMIKYYLSKEAIVNVLGKQKKE